MNNLDLKFFTITKKEFAFLENDLGYMFFGNYSSGPSYVCYRKSNFLVVIQHVIEISSKSIEVLFYRDVSVSPPFLVDANYMTTLRNVISEKNKRIYYDAFKHSTDEQLISVTSQRVRQYCLEILTGTYWNI